MRVKTRRTVPPDGRPDALGGNAARPVAPWKTARAFLRSPNTVSHGAGRADAEVRDGSDARIGTGNRGCR